jgi:hypothetical protein
MGHLRPGADQVHDGRGGIGNRLQAVARVSSTARRSWPACGLGDSRTRRQLPAPAGRGGRANAGFLLYAGDDAQACAGAPYQPADVPQGIDEGLYAMAKRYEQPIARPTRPRRSAASTTLLLEHGADQTPVLLLISRNCGMVACILRYCGSAV